MKTRLAALAVLLMTGAATAALAQDQGDQHQHQQRQRPDVSGGERPGMTPGQRPAEARAWRGPSAIPNSPPQAPQARQAPVPQPPRPPAVGRWGGGPPGGWNPPAPARPQADRAPGAPQARPPPPHTGGDGRNFTSRPGPWVDSHGDRSGPPPQGDRRARPEGQGSRDWRGYTGGPYDGRAGRPPQVDSWGGDHRDRGDHRDGGDHRDRAGHRDRGDHPQWRPGAFPHSYRSYHRYHVRPYFYPPHWFAHDWMFGEFLPEAWFAPQYLIEDWWDFGLPEPPYGYDWVRVGTDALLIDEYDGRIVQVVRYVFW